MYVYQYYGRSNNSFWEIIHLRHVSIFIPALFVIYIGRKFKFPTVDSAQPRIVVVAISCAPHPPTYPALLDLPGVKPPADVALSVAELFKTHHGGAIF